MAGAQFQYDERGGTFYYFIISFYALILIPATYLFWPKISGKGLSDEQKRCHCEGCDAKEVRKRLKQPWAIWKKRLIKFFLLLAWIGFILLAYKVVNIENDHVEYDPYIVLELDRGASESEIRKAYRKLSLKHHPDRGGDPKKFVLISKAYQALTNEESRKNWEDYGNPDGPGATQFGIALPKWLVSKEYGSFVLFGYIFLFMIVLPVGVGIWWYNSIKYSIDQVLMDTTHLYGYMFHKTPQMVLRRILMVLGGSFEFAKPYNAEIIERPSDDKEVPMLIKDLQNLGEKNKEKPLCYPYSVKARALIHAHLWRTSLPPDTLDKDKDYILRKCPILIQEMIQVVSQLVMLAGAGRVQRMPSLETVENVMKLLPLLVQAMWEKQSPLLQLPHFTEDMLRYCVTKKRRIKTTADLAALEEEDRLSLFRSLSASQYEDIRTVLTAMPRISVELRHEVQGEEDKETVTAGSLVTIYVKLIRKSLLDKVTKSESDSAGGGYRNDEEDEALEDEEEPCQMNGEVAPGVQAASQVKQRKPWEKAKKKPKKGGGGGGKGKKPQQVKPAVANSTAAQKKTGSSGNVEGKTRENKPAENSDDGSVSDREVSDDEPSDVRDALEEIRKPDSEDEDSMEFDDDLIRKDRILETKSKITHPVHCPFFPEEKYEWWWVYICDRKRRILLSGPVHCTTLINEEEVELKLQAPGRPGVYTFQACVKSDSYVDADVSKDIKLNVIEATEVTSHHPQWDFSSDEEEKKSVSEHSDGEYTTEEDEDD